MQGANEKNLQPPAHFLKSLSFLQPDFLPPSSDNIDTRLAESLLGFREGNGGCFFCGFFSPTVMQLLAIQCCPNAHAHTHTNTYVPLSHYTARVGLFVVPGEMCQSHVESRGAAFGEERGLWHNKLPSEGGGGGGGGVGAGEREGGKEWAGMVKKNKEGPRLRFVKVLCGKKRETTKQHNNKKKQQKQEGSCCSGVFVGVHACLCVCVCVRERRHGVLCDACGVAPPRWRCALVRWGAGRRREKDAGAATPAPSHQIVLLEVEL